MIPEAGNLDTLITLLQPIESTDAAGQPAIRYKPLNARIWASVSQPSGDEVTRNNLTGRDVMLKITMRYRMDINGQWCIEHRKKRYALAAVIDPDQDRSQLDLYACAPAK